MKCLCIMIGCCLTSGVMADALGFDISDAGLGRILQSKRSVSHFDLLPRTLQLPRPNIRPGALGYPPNRFPAKFRLPLQRETRTLATDAAQKKDASMGQNASPNKDSPNGKQNRGPDAKASIQTKGSAAIHVMSPGDYHDAYIGAGKAGRLDVEHYHKVLAAGSVQGDPGTPIPDAAKQAIKDHPLIAKGQARAVSGQVTAPRGGAGHIKVETPEKTQEFSVAGGQTRRRIGVASGTGQAKVTASVTHGGHVRVIGGADRDSLKKFPVQEMDWRKDPREQPAPSSDNGASENSQ